MTFADTVRDDLVAVFYKEGEFAQVVTYEPKNGFAKTISALIWVDTGEHERRGADDYGQIRRVRIMNHSVVGVTLPIQGDVVRIDHSVYAVTDVLPVYRQEVSDGLEWELVVSRKGD